MRWFGTGRAGGAVVLAAAISLLAVAATSGAHASTTANQFDQFNLVADTTSFGAVLIDKSLSNPWALASAPGSPVWVADHDSGMATVYEGGFGGQRPILRDLAAPIVGGNPTGQVFNGDTSAFPVGGPKGHSAVFIVATDSTGTAQPSGAIEAWAYGAAFVVEASPNGGPGGKTPAGSVFKGLALVYASPNVPELLAADVGNARIDVFNRDFVSMSTPTQFRDPQIPAGYAPDNVQLLGGRVYVTYGKQNSTKTDVIPGAGFGFVDVYSVAGQLIRHLVAHGPLNEPWGITIAPSNPNQPGLFGPFTGDLLVGNHGDGRINAFSPTSGQYLGTVDDGSGHPKVISGLRGLMSNRSDVSAFGPINAVVFSASPNDKGDGLVGVVCYLVCSP